MLIQLHAGKCQKTEWNRTIQFPEKSVTDKNCYRIAKLIVWLLLFSNPLNCSKSESIFVDCLFYSITFITLNNVKHGLSVFAASPQELKTIKLLYKPLFIYTSRTLTLLVGHLIGSSHIWIFNQGHRCYIRGLRTMLLDSFKVAQTSFNTFKTRFY